MPWLPVTAGGTPNGMAAVEVPDPRRVVLRMVLTAVVVLLLVGLGGIIAASRLAQRDAIHNGADMVNLLADAVVQPALTDGILTGDPSSVAKLDAAVRSGVLSRDIVRVKLWTPNGVILYSDEPRLVGRQFPLSADKRLALAHPSTRAVVSAASAPENLYEQNMGDLLEAYRPVWTPSGQELLFEVYSPYGPVVEQTTQLWRAIAGLLVTMMALFAVLLAPVLWRLVKQLREVAAQREVLLSRAVAASEDERRRLAASLHDGPVQELVATSYVLSSSASLAAGEGRPDLAANIRDAVGTVRTTIGSLRSLLVDLYPSSLARSGLENALTDLAATVRARGVPVELDLDPQALAVLTDPDERNVYRITQECLRNVVAHAHATTCSIYLATGVEPGSVVLEIADDGDGFDPMTVLDKPPTGHLGVHLLADVAASCGGRLEAASAPGRGTRWRLTLTDRTERRT